MPLLIILIAWLYVALMMAVAEALHPDGHWWGGLFTFLLYGVAPVSLVLYLFSTPMRRKARAKAEAAARQTADLDASGQQADDGGLSPRDSIAPEREEA